jgi:hypothetical protein
MINCWLGRCSGPVDAHATAVQNVRRADGQLGGQAFTLLVQKTDKDVILEPLHDGHEALTQVKDPWLLLSMDGHNHKVLKYVEYRAASGVFQNIDPPLHPASACVLPPHQKRVVHTTHSPGGEGGGGLIFWTPDIGFASYSINSLRA